MHSNGFFKSGFEKTALVGLGIAALRGLGGLAAKGISSGGSKVLSHIKKDPLSAGLTAMNVMGTVGQTKSNYKDYMTGMP